MSNIAQVKVRNQYFLPHTVFIDSGIYTKAEAELELFVVFRPTRECITHMEMVPFSVKG